MEGAPQTLTHDASAGEPLAVPRYFTTPGVHPFDSVAWELRDARIGFGGTISFEQTDVEFPSTWSQNATNIVAQKYFRGKLDSPSRERSVKQMIGRVSGTIADWGRQRGYFASAEDGDAFEAELTYILLHQMAAFNSPVWFNVGFEETPQCSACFILSVEDTMDSILDWNTREGRIFRGGSGSGINLSKIRGSMETLSKGGTASGPVSFMRGADAWAGTIKSGGKTRRAAKMVVLDVDHPDIREFIWCKAKEEDKARALAKAGFDMSLDGDGMISIQYQNANNSVRVTDEFMRAVENDEEWRTTSRATGEPIGEPIDARELMREIADAAWRCADPGVQYDTTINQWHTSPNSGRINASNPCFPADARVHTTRGLMAFGELYERWQAGEEDIEVYTHRATAGENGSVTRPKGDGVVASRPVRVMRTGVKPIVLLRFANGSQLRCTPNHRLWTLNRGYVSAEELTAADRVLAVVAAAQRVVVGTGGASDEAWGYAGDEPTSLVAREDDGQEVVYNLTEPLHHSYLVDGVVVANCSEYMHVDDSACNLSSLNLMKFRRVDGTFDVRTFEHAVDIMFLAQEIVVGPSSYPTEEIGVNARAFRQLGLGYANLGAYLMADGLAYDSDAGRGVAAAITSLMTGRGYLQSAKVAAAIGPYERYAENRDAHNGVMRMHRDASYAIPDTSCSDTALLEASRTVWDEAVTAGELYGYRNAQASVLAPTGTISFLMDCDTTGVEPDFSLVKYKTLVGGGTMTIANRTVPLALETLGYAPEQIEQIEAHVAEHNTMTGAPGLKVEHMPVFDVAVGENAISYRGHIMMMGAVQPFLSGAISKTVNMPAESTVEDIADAYLQAWHLGVKALAIYRDGSKNTQVLGNTEAVEAIIDVAELAARAGLMTPEEVEARVAMAVSEATAKAATTAVAAPVAPAVTVGRTAERRRMPRERQSITHKFSIGGHEGYITCGMYEDGTVGEIFLTDIGKEGSTMRGMMNSFATAISIALQYGVPLETLVQKFAYMRFEPEGITQNPEIPFAKSMPDYIMRWLASRFLDADAQEELGILTPEVRRRKEVQDIGLSYTSDTAAPPATTAPAAAVAPVALLTDVPPVVPVATRKSNFGALELGPACGQCGGMMQRTGSCYTCPSCGNNTGCG